VIGVLCVNRLGQNAPFTAMDARLVTIFAEHVAGALQRLGEISDLDRRTLDLETSNQHLARLNRMHELFLIAVRREMRSPLAAIQACADRLQREGTGMASERHDHLARAILEQAAQLRDVLTEVLELSRLEAGHAALARSAVPPNDILRNAVRVVESVAAQSEIHFETDLSPVPPAHLDAAKWRRALEFLLLGAVRLSSTGDVLRARSVTQGDDLTITLSGFGSGAAAGDLQACAQALDASPDGPGAPESLSLGLLVAQRYVEMHGGTLRLLNANGPVFRVHLPARARALPPGAPLEIEPPLARPAARAPAAEAPAAEAPAAEAPAAEAPAAEPAWNEAKEAA
jgi:K+-sensing histidine kinase KdpD